MNDAELPFAIRDPFFRQIKFPDKNTPAKIAQLLSEHPGLGRARHIGASGETGLMLCMREYSLPLLQILLPHSDPLATDSEGRNALMKAAEAKFEQGVEHLLRAQPSAAHAVDVRGNTALMIAASVENADCVKLLLACSDAAVRNKDGRTALMLALQVSASGFLAADCALALLEATPLLKIDNQGDTHLHYVARMGDPHLMATFLCRAPELMHFRNARGKTALQVALSRLGRAPEHTECVDVFASHCSLRECQMVLKTACDMQVCPERGLSGHFPRMHARLEREALRAAVPPAAETSGAGAPGSPSSSNGAIADSQGLDGVGSNEASSRASTKPNRRL